MIFSEDSGKKCASCGKKFERIDVWKQDSGRFRKKYLCRICLKSQHPKRQILASHLRQFRKRADYTPDDRSTDQSRISDAEFDSLIEEFEQGSWSGNRTYAEYKKHEDYILFLLRMEFRRRAGFASRETIRNDAYYYDILCVNADATQDEIREAYKRLAIKWHPDRNRDNAVLAESMFKKIREAYEVLRDPKRRKLYDEAGSL